MKKFFNNLLGFIGYCLSERLVLISLLGYILILISPMFSWYSSALAYTGVSEEFSFNMFQLSGGQVKEKSYIAMGVFVIINSIALMLIEYFDYKIKLRSRLSASVLFEILMYIGLIVIVVMAIKNDTLVEKMSYRAGEVEALIYWIKDATGYCNHGVGPILYIIGLSVAILSKVGVYIYYFIDNVKDSLTSKKGEGDNYDM